MTFKTGDKVTLRPYHHQQTRTGSCRSVQTPTPVPATVIDPNRSGSGNVVVEFDDWTAPHCPCTEYDRTRAIVTPRELARR